MITVDEALGRIFALCTPMPVEAVPLAQAANRVLARPVVARRDQPPFAASAMDGYAVKGPVAVGQSFTVVGEAGAGNAFAGALGPGQALRIFTGAPVPEGADTVVIQEDVTREGDTITLQPGLGAGTNIRPAGNDFRAGDALTAPRRLRPVDLGLIASMNVAEVPVHRRPVVAIIATGDELVMPGEEPAADQIVASSVFALKAMVEAEGAETRILPIARDSVEQLTAVLTMARGADVIVTLGGASVGDHDLVAPVTQSLGAERAFYKIAMRPGKPLMAGRLFEALMVGLPGNPVSALVCAQLFLLPAIRALLGLGSWPAPTKTALLAAPVAANGPRAHYMRAVLEPEGRIRALARQDSALVGVLAQADALLIRPIGDPERPEGHAVRYLPLQA
ncbi:MAG: molybdopterin molybdotransferase MoeA [Rhodobacter sp.]|nr:molybdopterin molybdotransferase MoeA [Paracoccaceae bacterium]MCC0075683.1 molybdopterin molybdotransferase MoeA [Rhodobacter sp.]